MVPGRFAQQSPCKRYPTRSSAAAAATSAAAAIVARSRQAFPGAFTTTSSNNSSLRQSTELSALARRAISAAVLSAAVATRPLSAMASSAGAAPGSVRQQQQQSVMDQVYGEYTGPGWQPAAFERTSPRYLWTDAFAVVNYLTLCKDTGEQRYLDQAVSLISAVHNTLGHTREGPNWLTGADKQHPAAAGLRIGKPHPEGHPDGDGQYFHYLTKWAFALAAASAVTKDSKYLIWAIEMMKIVHQAFTYQAVGGGPKRMYWKMSIDLSHPAVTSMGNLDPYDGLVTYNLLQQQARKMGVIGADVLSNEIADMQAMVDIRYERYHSDDPLDLGEALWLSHWHKNQADWARHISDVSLEYLSELWDQFGYFDQPLNHRLAFREFGTSLGLQALMSVQPDLPDRQQWQQRVDQIHSTWALNLNTRDNDITPVMYAASLNPELWLKGAWDNL